MSIRNGKVAIIDMGTNTFHLLIAEIAGQESFKIVLNERVAVKIGEGGISSGIISGPAQERGLKTLSNFRKIIDSHSVSQVQVFATSALRSASNSHIFLNKVHTETGLSPEIIDGMKEAEFIYYGVLAGLELSEVPDLIIDIGGGSIEFIIANKERMYWRRSYEIGAQRLTDRFHTSEPIKPEQLTMLDKFLDTGLKSLVEALSAYRPQSMIGVAGTFDTLSDIYRVQNNLDFDPDAVEGPFSIDSFEKIQRDLTDKTLEERIQTPGMTEFRAGMIVVALAVIKWLLKKHSFNKIRNSRYSLKEGVLYSMIINNHN